MGNECGIGDGSSGCRNRGGVRQKRLREVARGSSGAGDRRLSEVRGWARLGSARPDLAWLDLLWGGVRPLARV